MADALLQSCRISDNVYSLSGVFSRGAVRDSMWRAQSLCERLFVSGSVPKKCEVLIVGGGVSGMISALSLISLGAQVTLIEKSDKLVPRQSQCNTRGICPTTFDFPFAHWLDGMYPTSGRRAKLFWRRDIASVAARQWIRAFNKKIRSHAKRASVLLNAKFVSCSVSASGVHACVEGTDLFESDDKGRKQIEKDFKLVLICVGIGEENLTIKGSDFASHAFWESDDPLFYFDDPAGNREFAGQPVLLGGGGDGSLGDFITLLTGQRHFAEVVSAVGFTTADRDAVHDIRLTLSAYHQLGGKKSEHRVLTKVQEQSVGLVDAIWQRPSVRAAVRNLLRPPDQRPFLQLAMQCYHFSFGYVSNRVIAQLLARALYEDLEGLNGGLTPFRLGVKIKNVSGLHEHVCKSDKYACAAAWHRVEFDQAVCPHVRCVPAFVTHRRCDVEHDEKVRLASPTFTPCRTVTLNHEAMNFRRILIRFGINYDAKLLAEQYGLPKFMIDGMMKLMPCRLVTPFYPV